MRVTNNTIRKLLVTLVALGALSGAGEAPDLCNYSFGSNVNFTNCFGGSSKISNHDSIPYEWK